MILSSLSVSFIFHFFVVCSVFFLRSLSLARFYYTQTVWRVPSKWHCTFSFASSSFPVCVCLCVLCCVHPFSFWFMSNRVIVVSFLIFEPGNIAAGDCVYMSILCVQFNFYSQYCSLSSRNLKSWSRVELSWNHDTHTQKRHDFVHELTSILFWLFCCSQCSFWMCLWNEKREFFFFIHFEHYVVPYEARAE